MNTQIPTYTEEEAHSQALLLAYLMSANLEGIKQLIPQAGASFNFNQCLYFLSYHNDAECIRYILPFSDPTHNRSEALRTAVQYGNPTTVALLLPVSAPKDCQDMLCEIVDQALEDPTEEWLNALSVCLNVAPYWSAHALHAVLFHDCATVAHVLYPYVSVENLLRIFEQNKNTQNSTIQQIHTRFKLDEIKSNHEGDAVNAIKKL